MPRVLKKQWCLAWLSPNKPARVVLASKRTNGASSSNVVPTGSNGGATAAPEAEFVDILANEVQRRWRGAKRVGGKDRDVYSRYWVRDEGESVDGKGSGGRGGRKARSTAKGGGGTEGGRIYSFPLLRSSALSNALSSLTAKASSNWASKGGSTAREDVGRSMLSEGSKYMRGERRGEEEKGKGGSERATFAEWRHAGLARCVTACLACTRPTTSLKFSL